MARSYQQGKFVPNNPEKYVGDVKNIVYRSSWERVCLEYFDNSPSIIKYCSEEVVIPYYNKIDMKIHKYYVDFALLVKTPDGSMKKYLVEVKPHAQTEPPVPSKTKLNKKRFLEECITYETNQAKWEAAREFCKKHNMEFMILTEKTANFR